jgi:hypothetical protein
MSDLHYALAEELEKLAAGYRALAGNQIETDEVTIQDISIILTEKMSKGKVVEIKSLLKKYGATKLVELKAEDYEAFYKEAKNL